MDVKTRLGWTQLFEQLGDAELVCRRCGISRPTLRKWWRRYQETGLAGLEEISRRPHRQASRKVFAEQETLILGLRRSRQLSIKQLRNELIRQHDLTLSLDTLHRVLVRHGEQGRGQKPRQSFICNRYRCSGRVAEWLGSLGHSSFLKDS